MAADYQQAPKSYLLAQTDPEEAYDPFTDYSEFDEASDEEADINFFRNGRFFTVGLAMGPCYKFLLNFRYSHVDPLQVQL